MDVVQSFNLQILTVRIQGAGHNVNMKTDDTIKALLGGLGCPEFRYLAPATVEVDPREVLLEALRAEDMDQRVIDALPWVLAHRSDLDLRKLTDQVRAAGLQNRLGFLIEVTVSAAKSLRYSEVTKRLEPWLVVLREVRHPNEDTLAKASMTQVERRRLRRSRSSSARFWRLLTDMNAKDAVKPVQIGKEVGNTQTKKNG